VPLPGFEQVPRYRDLIERLLGEDIDFLPPGFLLELDRPEWRYLKRELFWTTGRVTVAGGTTNAKINVLNPVGSGRLVIVTGAVLVAKATAGQARIAYDAALGATPANNLSMDTRAAPRVVSTNLISNNTGLSGVFVDEITTTVAAADAVSRVLPQQPVILSEGHSVALMNATVAEGMIGYLWGYERPARPEELAQ